MIEPNILAFQNADVLTLLDDAPNGRLTKAAIAEATGRDWSNLNKTLRRLADEGLLQSDPTAGLTDDGRAQLAAYKRAQHGGERKRARGQWPLDRFKPNPLNRPVRREALPEMAASMRGPAGLVQRVRATEPDANGVRMLIDGEHRWEAAKLVAAQVVEEGGDIPDWLADGLPFEEGTADPATALIITLVANARRADMSPWDDAQQLLKLQMATDWSASELARQIGRVSEGERTGLRDVQQKLKIAREATPEAVAEYERTGSWDTLRASVATPKPQTIGEQVAQHGAAVLSGPHVVNGVDYGNATRANDARRALGLLPPLPTPNYGSAPRPETRPGPPAQTPVVPVSTPEDDQHPVTPEQDAPAPITRDDPPALPPAAVMSAHLKALVQSREHPTNAALRLIADERKRQVEAEGFTPETDDRDNADLELAYGAAAYAASAAGDADASLFWPSGWNPYLFKPTGDVRDLVRAGALIVAELERRAREAAASHPALLETAQ